MSYLQQFPAIVSVTNSSVVVIDFHQYFQLEIEVLSYWNTWFSYTHCGGSPDLKEMPGDSHQESERDHHIHFSYTTLPSTHQKASIPNLIRFLTREEGKTNKKKIIQDNCVSI